jgi:nitrogen fixation NifU-like protein
VNDCLEVALWDHADATDHRGRVSRPSGESVAVNPLCGDEVQFSLRFSADGRVEEARYIGRGCQISQAAASLLCERIHGRDRLKLTSLSRDEVLGWNGIQLSPIRQACALVAWEALKRALRKAGEAIRCSSTEPIRLVLLDRDDTLIRIPSGVRYLTGDNAFQLVPGAGEFLVTMNGLGVAVVDHACLSPPISRTDPGDTECSGRSNRSVLHLPPSC